MQIAFKFNFNCFAFEILIYKHIRASSRRYLTSEPPSYTVKSVRCNDDIFGAHFSNFSLYVWNWFFFSRLHTSRVPRTCENKKYSSTERGNILYRSERKKKQQNNPFTITLKYQIKRNTKQGVVITFLKMRMITAFKLTSKMLRIIYER